MLSVIIIIISMILASFYNVIIYRLLREESLLYPASHCPSCKYPIKNFDLIPIFSYLFLLGKCRNCNKKISFQYFFVELLVPVLNIYLFVLLGLSFKFFILVFLTNLLLIISMIDIKHKIIPDILIIIGIIFGVIFNLFGSIKNITDSFFAIFIGSGILVVINLISKLLLKKEAFGGGDIKLLAMLGLYSDTKTILLILLFSIYFAGLISFFLVLFRFKNKKDYIAFAPFISLSSLVILLYGDIILNTYLSFLS